MKSLLKLLNSYYLKGFFGPFFLVVFPIFLLFIIGNAMVNMPGTTSKTMQVLVGGIMITSLLSAGLFGLPMMIIEFKKSTLMKRIGAAQVSKPKFLVAVIIYQCLWALFTVFWVLLWAGIIIGTKSGYDWSVAFPSNFWESFPFILMTLLMSMSIGMLIVSVSNTQQGVMAITNVLYLPISFLSGSFFPKTSIDNSSALNGISYVLPTKYVVDPFFTVFKGGLSSLNGWEGYTYPIIGITLIVIMLATSIKYFKWS